MIWIGRIGLYRGHSLIHPIDPMPPIQNTAAIEKPTNNTQYAKSRNDNNHAECLQRGCDA